MSADARLDLARAKTKRILDHLTALHQLQATNDLVVYSPMLSSQIPVSRAAHAFNSFQDALHKFGVIRIAALWDKPSADRDSLPTVAALLSSAEVVTKAIDEVRIYHLNQAEPRRYSDQADDPIEQEFLSRYWQEYCVRRSEQEAQSTRFWIRRSMWAISRVNKCSAALGIRRHRDNFIAHNLVHIDATDQKTASRPMKYGDERKLLSVTTKIVRTLHLGVNGTSFDMAASMSLADRRATELWEG